ncbi:hypothetical protein [Gilvimarinus polysaccharolyticus]|uniref:hypothetical protein n=1 Tax=Gilvimarinus polysaccharolyticus TaxID=863921 RepID=UPI00067354E0|nr:hypothetical protein [Gilvimarinus polysaccharolyticus]
MKLIKQSLAFCAALMVSSLALAHPHHDAHVSDHIHFSVISLVLVGIALVGYFVFFRKGRDQSEVRHEQPRNRD